MERLIEDELPQRREERKGNKVWKTFQELSAIRRGAAQCYGLSEARDMTGSVRARFVASIPSFADLSAGLIESSAS